MTRRSVHIPFDPDPALRADLTSVLSGLFILILVTCVALAWNHNSALDDLVQPLGAKSQSQNVTSGPANQPVRL